MVKGKANWSGKTKSMGTGGGGDMVYCLGLIGAWVYYVGNVDGFGNIVVAIIKGFLWPAFLVYNLLGA